MTTVRELLDEIARALPDGGDWCSLEKAETLASIVVGLRPSLIVEIGVWMGGSLIPMMLAQKHAGRGFACAIDPWSPDASVAGETEKNAAWWTSVDHEAALACFRARLDKHALAERCRIFRNRSDDVEPFVGIDLLHVDGNHREQAFRDVDRFAPGINIGGILVLDDVGWDGGHVQRAYARAVELGFAELYPLGTGVVMQRVLA